MGLLRNYVRVRPATYEEDGLDSVTSLTNPAGALANSYTFDSSGQVKTRSILTAVSADLSQRREAARVADEVATRWMGFGDLLLDGQQPKNSIAVVYVGA
jgi:hypothetical protein